MLGLGLGLAGRAAGGSSDWLATSVSDCRAWYRASLGVTDDGGGKASAWADQSGAGDANRDLAQATATNRPTINAANANFNGKATIDFDGVDNFMRSGAFSASYAMPTTFYMVVRLGDNDSGDYLWDSANVTGNRQALLISGTAWFPYAGGSDSGGTHAIDTTYVLCCVYNTASSAFYKSQYDTAAFTGNFGSLEFDSLTVGQKMDTSGGYLNGAVGELIVYSGAHNSATRQTVMEALGSRYGVAVTA